MSRDHIAKSKLVQGDTFTWVDIFQCSVLGSSWLSFEIDGVEFSNIFLDSGTLTSLSIHGRRDTPYTNLVCETIPVTMKLNSYNGMSYIDEDSIE